MNGVFSASISIALLTLFPFGNLIQLAEENGTETLSFDDSTYSNYETEESTFSTESVDNASYSDSVTELSSDSSVENETESENSTSFVNQTETTTFIPPETERHSNVWMHYNETFCSCDLLVQSCDVNCCCDEDCTDEDIQAFPACFSTHLVPKSDYCFDSDIIYRNNTPYKKIVDEVKGLFCVAHDNFQERLKFKDVPSFTTVKEFNRLYAADVYSWNSDFKVEKPVTSSQMMRAGDPLYITTSQSSEIQFKWRLPSLCFTTLCECGKDILYMEDVQSSCVRPFSSTKDTCEKTAAFSADFFQKLCVVSKSGSKPDDIPTTTASATTTTTMESTTESPTHTEASTGCIQPSGWPTPRFNNSNKVCMHVVQSVNYTVHHNGTHGITNIVVDFHFGNISSGESSVMQHFSIKFKWNSNLTVTRSGNPGYRIGLPVLTGTDNNRTHPSVKMEFYGLTILNKDSDGFCTYQRKTVSFGQNVRTGCYVKGAFATCRDFQENIRTALGISEAPMFVGTFGNADPQNPGDWIEIFHEESSQNEQSEEDSLCNNKLITGLVVDIAYAAVGLLADPQYKIIGVVFRYTRTPDIHLKSTTDDYLDKLSDHFNSNTVEISTSVTFYDVSDTAVPAFARVPVLRAKLPHDFFYPFLLSSSQAITCTVKFYALLVHTWIILQIFNHIFS